MQALDWHLGPQLNSGVGEPLALALHPLSAGNLDPVAP
jgi:hypothetical protein